MEANNNINERGIYSAFTALESKINSFVSDFALKELLSVKDKKVKVVFDTPFYANYLNCEFLERDYYKHGYIKELYAYFIDEDKFFITNFIDDNNFFVSVGITNNYIDNEEKVECEKVRFTDLSFDSKALVASELEQGNYFIVGDDFKNHCYKVIEDFDEIYQEGDYITTTLLIRDFRDCNGEENADTIAHLYSLIYNNKGEELVNNICEWWDDLKLEKVY